MCLGGIFFRRQEYPYTMYGEHLNNNYFKHVEMSEEKKLEYFAARCNSYYLL